VTPPPQDGMGPFRRVVRRVLAKGSPLTPTQRLVAVVIADHLPRAFPSVATIAVRAGLSRSAVTAAVKVLCDGPTPVFAKTRRGRGYQYHIVSNPIAFAAARAAHEADLASRPSGIQGTQPERAHDHLLVTNTRAGLTGGHDQEVATNTTGDDEDATTSRSGMRPPPGQDATTAWSGIQQTNTTREGGSGVATLSSHELFRCRKRLESVIDETFSEEKRAAASARLAEVQTEIERRHPGQAGGAA